MSGTGHDTMAPSPPRMASIPLWKKDDASENQRAYLPGLQWHRVSNGEATGAVRSETVSGPVQDLRGKRENCGRCRLSGIKAMNRRGVDFTLVQVEPGLWQWQFQIGESVVRRICRALDCPDYRI